jgi:hypothetical protein
MKMLLNNTRLRILDLLDSPSTNPHTFAHKQQRAECLSHIKFTAGALASTMPYSLQKIRIAEHGPHGSSWISPNLSIALHAEREISPYMASLVTWPLTIASSLEEGLDLEQKLWFRSELANLGRVVGVGVVEFAETDTWFRL